MHVHRNAKLGLAGRRELVLAIASGSSIRKAAAGFNVSPATAHRWWSRWHEAGARQRRSLACLLDRSSRPRSSPRRLAAEAEHAICECRRKTGWGPRLVAGATGYSHSTVWKVLHRFGLSRPERPPREPANRYEWPCPGDLLHVDCSRYVRYFEPGHRVTGDRSTTAARRRPRKGVDYVHAVVDDHSRLAYAEVHADERSPTAVAFLERALAFYAAHGIEAKRVMTDNAFTYVRSRALRELFTRHAIEHITTRPYRPRTNGKVERFHQTMAREWAYGLVYRSHHERAAALPHWLTHYNTHTPHSSLGDGPR